MSHPTRCAAGAFVRRVSSFLCLLLILNFPAPPARASAPTAVKDSTAAAVPAAAVEKPEPAAPAQPATLARTSAAAALQSPQTPYSGTPINLPGTIPASDFDNGGEGVAYHDNVAGCDSNCSYRSTDVDMYDRVVWHTRAGEWLEYTVNVTAAGTYTLMFDVASGGPGGTFHA
ncbi:MAG TPA: hypothetical protein VK422_13030 [Pyrinomonadaceae bacterium]|nr:hypothetical protein [Pyrinomonadaceae bacterium]